MKNVLLAIAATGMAVASSAAVAADLPPTGPTPYYSAPAPVGLYNWAGAYAGLNVGYQWGKVSNSNAEPSGLLGGLQGGYNWQRNQLVFGIEGDLQVTGAEDTFAAYKFSNPWFGTIRGRIGYAMNNVLFYGTGGLAFGDLTGEAGGIDETKTEVGWTAGLGMEVGFTPNWSAKVEYLYMDLASQAFAATGGVDNGFQTNILRFGINYRF